MSARRRKKNRVYRHVEEYKLSSVGNTFATVSPGNIVTIRLRAMASYVASRVLSEEGPDWLIIGGWTPINKGYSKILPIWVDTPWVLMQSVSSRRFITIKQNAHGDVEVYKVYRKRDSSIWTAEDLKNLSMAC